MEKILQHIQTLTAIETEWKNLVQFLESQSKTLGRDLAAAQRIDAALEKLDPHLFTLGHSFLLDHKAQIDSDPTLFIRQAIQLLTFASAHQVMFKSEYFIHVALSLASRCLEVDRPIAAIQALRQAVLLLQHGNPNTLTSLHCPLLKLCLKAKCYNVALPFIEPPVYHTPKRDLLNAEDLLSTFYYAGMIYLGLKRYSKALESFQLVLTTPSTSLSIIHINAYQKFVLISLLSTGELADLPHRLTSICVSRSVDKFCPVYMKFAQAYALNLQEVTKVVEENKDLLKKDGNFGLAKQCVTAWIRRSIQKLTSTYMSLSLADISERTGVLPAEVEKHLLGMIAEGQILARISQRDGVVSFQDDPERFDTTQMVQRLDAKIREVSEMTALIKRAERDISLDSHYVAKQLRRTAKNTGDMDDADMAAAIQASMNTM